MILQPLDSVRSLILAQMEIAHEIGYLDSSTLGTLERDTALSTKCQAA